MHSSPLPEWIIASFPCCSTKLAEIIASVGFIRLRPHGCRGLIATDVGNLWAMLGQIPGGDTKPQVRGVQGASCKSDGNAYAGSTAAPATAKADSSTSWVFARFPRNFVVGIAATREVAQRFGGVVDPAHLEWRFDRHRVCDGHDPEGNVFQLRQVETATSTE